MWSSEAGKGIFICSYTNKGLPWDRKARMRILNYLTEYSWLADETRTWQKKINCNFIIILLGFCNGSLKFQIDFILHQCSPFALIRSLLFPFFDCAQIFLVVDVTYHVPCLESHFKGFHLTIAHLPGLFGRLLRVEVKKPILGSRKEKTHLLNYRCCVNSAPK